MQIIPAIDIINGACVRLEQGDYSKQKTYNQDPLEVAKAFEASGITRLHLVDLDGAKSKHIVNYKVLENIASNTSLIIDFGGGLKSNEDLRIAFESGASQITGGSIAVSEPELFLNWVEVYGPGKIILGADCKDGTIATHGWKAKTTLKVHDFIADYQSKGIEQVICTDIAKDGMLQGPSFDLYKELMEQTPIKLIASGGVSSMEDLINLKEIGCYGTILGKAIYEGNITLKELEVLC